MGKGAAWAVHRRRRSGPGDALLGSQAGHGAADQAGVVRQAWSRCWRGTGPESGALLKQSGADADPVLVHWGHLRQLADDPAGGGSAARLRRALSDRREDPAVIATARSTRGRADEPWDSARDERRRQAIIDKAPTEIQHCRRELKKLTRPHEAIQRRRRRWAWPRACVLWMCLGDPRPTTPAPRRTARRWA